MMPNMSSIITVRKTRLAEAVQINSPEEEEVVLGWIVEQLVTVGLEPEDLDSTALDELKAQHVYFMRDEGSPIVYVTAAADFLTYFEEVSEEELEAKDDPFKDFKFDA